MVGQVWLGVACRLTTWEMALRAGTGAATYVESFIQHWLQSLLYYSAPDWFFIVVYTVFGGLVLASWFVCGAALASTEHRWIVSWQNPLS
ncbi:DUF2784 domain-containing protein [Vreelandella arcis]|uniref:DUF2784 domain-containing protein n=1 Tax=Vreelandella arcis TaxID=416873 RepID=UPI000B7E7AA0|nr:DUF2784 domain-containing protein [Halomonas arcis]